MNKHIYPIFKEKIKKMKECTHCHKDLVVHGNRTMHPWCSLEVKRERENAFNRLKTQERRYEIHY